MVDRVVQLAEISGRQWEQIQLLKTQMEALEQHGEDVDECMLRHTQEIHQCQEKVDSVGMPAIRAQIACLERHRDFIEKEVKQHSTTINRWHGSHMDAEPRRSQIEDVRGRKQGVDQRGVEQREDIETCRHDALLASVKQIHNEMESAQAADPARHENREHGDQSTTQVHEEIETLMVSVSNHLVGIIGQDIGRLEEILDLDEILLLLELLLDMSRVDQDDE
ncbi:MAG: hypothetical protein Q9174_004356 [Haloplaca sp. 1 TL-2023]